MSRHLTLACIQYEPRIGEVSANRDEGLTRAEAAVRDGAQVLVLPELSNSGYVFESRAEALGLSETADGPTVSAWAAFARDRNVHLVAGYCEREGADLYNSAAIVGPAGLIGTYRKAHLWYEEPLVFEPGNCGFPVFNTAIGRLGALICYDGWFPESWRILALRGAEIVCVPTNWVPMPN